MTTVIKKGTNKKALKQMMQKALAVKGVNTHKHCGVIKLKEEPLEIQRRMRDEWE